jgi:hypothetical protein
MVANIPPDFPMSDYQIVEAAVDRWLKATRHGDETPLVWYEFVRAWQAAAHRFRMCAEHDQAFTEAIAVANCTHEDLYIRDRALFLFFVTALSTIESICYAAFALASMLRPSDFPLGSNKDRARVSVETVRKAFGTFYPNRDITLTLGGLTADPTFRQISDARNIQAHRQLPQRTLSVSLTLSSDPAARMAGSVETQVSIDDRSTPHGMHTMVLDLQTTASRRRWLVDTTKRLVDGLAGFTRTEFQAFT